MTQHNNYHPCTSILIEALRNMEGGDKVLKEWDKQRQIVDKKWQAAKADSEREILELKADNERLRKGLQFYADGRHYDYCDKQSSERFGLDWVVEYGDIASEALSAAPKE